MLYILSPFPLTKVGVGRVTTKGVSAGQSGCVSHVLAGYSQAVDTVLYSLDWLQPSNLSHQRNWFVAPFCPNPVPTHFTLIALSETPIVTTSSTISNAGAPIELLGSLCMVNRFLSGAYPMLEYQ